MKHAAVTHCALDAYDFDDASAAAQELVDECRSWKRRTKRQQRRGSSVNGADNAATGAAAAAPDALRFTDLRAQDPAVFAHLLADHFVAKEANNAAASAALPLESRQRPRPVAGAVSLASFRSWQFGERCLATYRVLFGRPLWAAATPTSVPPFLPCPRKRMQVTLPTSSSSESSEGDELDAMALETTEEMLAMPTVDELLELPTDDMFSVDGRADMTREPLEEDDMLTEMALDLDAGDMGDAIDLLWELDAADVDGGAMLTGSDDELRFLTASPSSFSPISREAEAMQDI
ncbi:unnamed protein product [Phytophthora fragariaefolia]|uniref:Unnamed protein product n=1 Tax=Phytophthora fragariaefolia TaxID=1490495 RepID=A0A9W6XN01_9STRA|nr:unnamed protein product [Phytophthora fragariaefolia]